MGLYLVFRDSSAVGAITFSIILLLIVAGAFFAKEAKILEQARRDRTANRMLGHRAPSRILGKGTTPGITLDRLALVPKSRQVVLFLRPFVSDNRVRVANPEKLSIASFLFFAAWIGSESEIDLEELLLKAVGRSPLFIGIGRPREGGIGAGKLETSDAEWQTYFTRLASRANCIISVPSRNQSTFWELEWLARNGMTSKVVMLFSNLHSSPDMPLFSYGELAESLQGIGWSLPPSIGGASLATFEAPRARVVGTKFKRRQLRAVIRRTMALNRTA